jgi:hypothetical protein
MVGCEKILVNNFEPLRFLTTLFAEERKSNDFPPLRSAALLGKSIGGPAYAG